MADENATGEFRILEVKLMNDCTLFVEVSEHAPGLPTFEYAITFGGNDYRIPSKDVATLLLAVDAASKT